MDGEHIEYVHSRLFQCIQCKEPLVICVMTAERNLENIDGNPFEVRCKCGWMKRLLGMEAVRHWVTPWEALTNETVREYFATDTQERRKWSVASMKDKHRREFLTMMVPQIRRNRGNYGKHGILLAPSLWQSKPTCLNEFRNVMRQVFVWVVESFAVAEKYGS